MSKVKIVYHNDPDGHCSAAIAGMALKARGYEVVYQAVGYGDAEIDMWDGEELVIVDFCFQPEEKMQEVIDFYGDRLTWIDHHKTAMSLSEKNPNVKGIRTVEEYGEAVSACELTWGFFYPMRSMPRSVRTVGDWDTWRHAKMENRVCAQRAVAFNLFLGSQNTHPEKYWTTWMNFFDYNIQFDDAVEKGKILLDYQNEQNRKNADKLAWEGTFNGIPAVFMNRRGNSQMFDSVYDPSRYNVMVGYEHCKNGIWTVSLYSTHDDIDCGELAKEVGRASPHPGGGGHKGAAGFQTTWRYFEWLVERIEL